MLERADAETVTSLECLAAEVCKALIEAGLPAALAVMSSETVPGGEVEVDPFDDAGGGVFVSWNVGNGLRNSATTALSHGQAHDAAIHRLGAVTSAMSEAMLMILRSAGFEVAPEKDTYRPFTLRVTTRKAAAEGGVG